MGVPDSTSNLREYLAAARSKGESESRVTVIRLSNAHSTPRLLYLEPWGDRIDLLAQADYDVVAYGPAAEYDRLVYEDLRGDWLTVQIDAVNVAIFSSTGTVGLAVFYQGQAIWQWPPGEIADAR